jgi:hypothetical protein
MILDFGDTVAEAMLEIGFLPGAQIPETADFSWKLRRKKGRFPPTAVALMRRFSQALNRSSWADLNIHLRKALVDAGASWASPLVEGLNRSSASAHSASVAVPAREAEALGDLPVPEAATTEPGGVGTRSPLRADESSASDPGASGSKSSETRKRAGDPPEQ